MLLVRYETRAQVADWIICQKRSESMSELNLLGLSIFDNREGHFGDFFEKIKKSIVY